MTDSIEILGLRFFARHGVDPQESVAGNEFEVDIRLDLDATEAMESDELRATVNYAEAVEIAAAEMAVPSKLIEHVAGRISRRLRERWPALRGGMVRVSKLAPPIPRQMARVAFKTEWKEQ